MTFNDLEKKIDEVLEEPIFDESKPRCRFCGKAYKKIVIYKIGDTYAPICGRCVRKCKQL